MLGGVGLRLGLVDRAAGVFRWRVDRDQSKRRVADAQEVVAGAGPDEDEVVLADLGALPIEDRDAAPVDEDEYLVGVGMDLLTDLGAWGDRHDDDLLVVAFSEFGRRVKENGSRGTDHGHGGPMLVLGGRVRGGFHGGIPSLTDLQNGDLKYTVDFRSVYATVLDRWLGADSAAKKHDCIRGQVSG